MTIQKITELESEPIVGEYYLVPCVWVSDDSWIPIIGNLHSDAELSINYNHYHQDVRFMDLNASTYNSEERASLMELGNIVHSTRLAWWKASIEESKIVLRKLQCLRTMPTFPLVDQKRYHRLYDKYEGKKVKCGKCPHRKFNLNQLPQDENGNVVCNGHGLLVSMKNKVVLNRFKEAEIREMPKEKSDAERN